MANRNKPRYLLEQISSKLTEECLQNYLQMSLGVNDVKLVRYEIGEDSAKEDNCISSITRMTVEGLSVEDNKQLTSAFIVKSLPANISRRKTFRSCEFFRNEANFYNEVLPRFLAFQEKKKPQKPFSEIPRCCEAFADGENDFIMMEDVSYSGYMAPKRQESFDYEHCCTVLQIMGRFHALSLAMKDQDPEEFKKAANSVKETYYYPENRQWYEDFLKKLTEVAMDAVSKELPGTLYEEKLKKFTDDGLFEQMINMAEAKEPYAVICQGDAWIPNFLFRYSKYGDVEKSRIEAAHMIDFQMSRYGSPVQDISFMIYSCTTKKIRDCHFDDLLQSYYRCLCEFITDLGSFPEKLFPYKSFQNEVTAYFAFGFGISLEAVPFLVMDESEAPDLDLMTGDQAVPVADVMAISPIKSQEGRLRLTDILRHAVDHEYL